MIKFTEIEISTILPLFVSKDEFVETIEFVKLAGINVTDVFAS